MTTPAATSTAVQRPPVDPAVGDAIELYGRLAVIRNVLAPDLNDQELQLFAMVAQRSRLDPFAKQIYAIKRGGRVTFQTGIDGFRSSAEETDEYRGSDEPQFGPIGRTDAIPFDHPEWARVVVHRQFPNGEWLHQPATVYFAEVYPGSGESGAMYRKMPRNQLAKCAEAAAFRKAFPKRFADVYTAEEMAQADAADAARPVGPTAAERVAARRAEHEAAVAAAEPMTCPQSPRGEPCELDPDHPGDEHRRGNKKWRGPKQAIAGPSAPAQATGTAPAAAVDSGEAPVEEAPATAPAGAALEAAKQVFAGDVVEPVPADVQAGMDLLNQAQPQEGSTR